MDTSCVKQHIFGLVSTQVFLFLSYLILHLNVKVTNPTRNMRIGLDEYSHTTQVHIIYKAE